MNSTQAQWLEELGKHCCKYSFYRLKTYNELNSKRLTYYELHNHHLLLQTKATTEADFIAIIKLDFMCIVSPAPSREYNVKSQRLFCLIMIMVIYTNGIQTEGKGIKRLQAEFSLVTEFSYSCYSVLQVYVVFVKRAHKVPWI